MTHSEVFLLAKEVNDLQLVVDKTGNGLVREKLKKKRAVLNKELDMILQPRNPQQCLYEAK